MVDWVDRAGTGKLFLGVLSGLGPSFGILSEMR